MIRFIEYLGKWVLTILAVILMSGCNRSMALSKNDTKLDLTKRSIAIMSIRVSVENDSGYQPFPYYISFGQKKDKFTAFDTFDIKSPFAQDKDKYAEYLISTDLPAGKYFIFGVLSQSELKGLPLPHQGVCWLPIWLPFELKPNEITYIGRIEATLRKKQDKEELTAGAGVGSSFMGQMASGYNSTTFDTIVSDNYDLDIQHFSQQYPVLKNYTVNKSLLPLGKQPNGADMLAREK